jgi:hypothetical protein
MLNSSDYIFYGCMIMNLVDSFVISRQRFAIVLYHTWFAGLQVISSYHLWFTYAYVFEEFHSDWKFQK